MFLHQVDVCFLSRSVVSALEFCTLQVFKRFHAKFRWELLISLWLIARDVEEDAIRMTIVPWGINFTFDNSLQSNLHIQTDGVKNHFII